MNIDKTKLTTEFKDAEYLEGLEGFAQALYKARPLFEFFVDNHCTIEVRKRNDDGSMTITKRVRRIKVVEGGEEVGAIGVNTRYRGGSSENVYEVQSFRIRKERGNREAIHAKDLKVALRVAKKTLVSRVDDELKELIGNKIRGEISSLHSVNMNQVRWDFNVEGEIAFMAMQAYEARLSNEPDFKMPAIPISVKDMKKHDAKCERYAHWNKLKKAIDAKQGYGIMVKADNSLVMYSLEQDSINHHSGFDELPPSIQEKFAMFKVLEENEGYSHIGCKLKDGMFFIAP